MLFIDSAHDLVRNWNARDVFKNEQEVLDTTQQCGYFAFDRQQNDVPPVILAIPELHQAWVKGWRAAQDDLKNGTSIQWLKP